MNKINIGVLSLQGDVNENILSVESILKKLDYEVTLCEINKKNQISKLDGLILPGGESTSIGKLSLIDDLLKTIKEKIKLGMPVLGICAGLIILSKNVIDYVTGKTDQPILNVLNVEVERNYFGRQQHSFEADIAIRLDKLINFKGVFIRAPNITKTGNDVEILSKFNNTPVTVKQNNILATTFHPELTNDSSLHEYFLNIIKNHK